MVKNIILVWCGGSSDRSLMVDLFELSLVPAIGSMTGNVLFNDVLNTFYIQLYGVGHMVKDHSDRGNMLLPLLLDGEGGRGVGVNY